MHGLDRIAGIDRALEGIRRLYRRDLRNLHDVEVGCDPGHDVLRGGRGGGDHGIVICHHRYHEGRDLLGNLIGELRSIGDQNLRHPIELGGSFRSRLAIVTGDEHMHFATEGTRCSQRFCRQRVEGIVRVFCD